jgi:hypothetical protein
MQAVAVAVVNMVQAMAQAAPAVVAQEAIRVLLEQLILAVVAVVVH